MRSPHLLAALTDDAFRIGTLYEFRDVERFGAQIGDQGEGKKTTYLTSPLPIEFDLLSDDPRATHARKVFKGWDKLPRGSTIRIRMEPNSSLEIYEHSPDMYVYCATTVYDSVQMRAFGYDSCLAINDAEAFFTALSRCMTDAEFVLGAEVQYGDRRVDHAMPGIAPAPFMKPSAYAEQREFRAVWKPLSATISPLIVRCPAAIQYCVQYDG